MDTINPDYIDPLIALPMGFVLALIWFIMWLRAGYKNTKMIEAKAYADTHFVQEVSAPEGFVPVTNIYIKEPTKGPALYDQDVIEHNRTEFEQFGQKDEER
jgi:hypothetical protein